MIRHVGGGAAVRFSRLSNFRAAQPKVRYRPLADIQGGKYHRPMNGSGVIAGIVLVSLPALVLGAGFASGNMFSNLNVDTNRSSAPATFWLVAGMWMLMGSFGLTVMIVNLFR